MVRLSEMPEPEKLVLLIEDSADDAFFFKRSLQNAPLRNPVRVVPDIDEAIRYFEGTAQYADRSLFPLPSIAVIDLNVPRNDGFDLVKWLRARPEFHHLHIIVVSGVNRMQDITRAYQLGASSFLTKPVTPEDLRQLANAFPEYWRVASHPC